MINLADQVRESFYFSELSTQDSASDISEQFGVPVSDVVGLIFIGRARHQFAKTLYPRLKTNLRFAAHFAEVAASTQEDFQSLSAHLRVELAQQLQQALRHAQSLDVQARHKANLQGLAECIAGLLDAKTQVAPSEFAMPSLEDYLPALLVQSLIRASEMGLQSNKDGAL